MLVAAVAFGTMLVGLSWIGRWTAARHPPQAEAGPGRLEASPRPARYCFAAVALWAGVMAGATYTPFVRNAEALSPGVIRDFLARPLDRFPFSGSDVVANTLSAVPLGLFGTAGIGLWVRPVCRRGLAARAADALFGALAAAGVAAAACGFAVALEAGQLFAAYRIPSKYDVLAQTAGAAGGGLLWGLLARPVRRAIGRGRSREVRPWQPIDAAAVIAAVCVAVWSVRPYQVVSGPGELLGKFREPWFWPVPFQSDGSAADLLWSIVRGIPLGFLAAIWRTPPDRPARRAGSAVAAGVAAVAVLEAAGILVRGRVFDGNDILAGAAGAAIGVAAAHWSARRPLWTPTPIAGRPWRILRRSAGLVAAAAALCVYAYAAGWAGA